MSIDSEKVTITGHTWSRKSGKVSLRVNARDQMKRPVAITIDVGLANENDPQAPEVLNAKPGQVAGIINGLAEIAWAGGWRPKDLMGAIAQTVATHKRGRWDQTPCAPVPRGGSKDAKALVEKV